MLLCGVVAGFWVTVAPSAVTYAVPPISWGSPDIGRSEQRERRVKIMLKQGVGAGQHAAASVLVIGELADQEVQHLVDAAIYTTGLGDQRRKYEIGVRAISNYAIVAFSPSCTRNSCDGGWQLLYEHTATGWSHRWTYWPPIS
jgi:hypothetical protein